MRIAHISDLHIRNFKYRDEYRIAFRNLYARLEELRPDLIVNTGDTVHSKLAVSPELFDDVAHHCIRVSEVAPYWIVLGNHDLNLKNLGRTDAISPIVRAIRYRTKHDVNLLEHPVSYGSEAHPGFIFWNYSIRHPGHKFSQDPATEDINIGLYHGSISGCILDNGFTMDEGESELSKFDGMDYVLMGDIHKRQSFRRGTIRYPGSLIQQNYGEELEKGFLLWDIRSKTDFSVDFHPIEAPGRFYTIQVPASLDVSGLEIPRGSRVRAMVEGELTPSRRMTLEKDLRERFDPVEVITPDSSDEMRQEVPDLDELVGSRERLMRDWLSERTSDVDQTLALFRKYEAELDSDGTARGSTWQLRRFSWDNMMNFGEGNVIDLSKLGGLVGIFAPNASGKSSIFDILLQALFDKIAKEVPRNIDLVNDNKNVGSMSVEFEAAGQPFQIERSIERIQYGQRSLAETRQWGKTTLDFSSVDESLNGTSRPETERSIREIIGSFEDFCLTTMVSQNSIFGLPGGGDIINCRETDRRKILFRFLDLDVYERIGAQVKDDLKELMGKLKGSDRDRLAAALEKAQGSRADLERLLEADRAKLPEIEAAHRTLTETLQEKKFENLLAALGRRGNLEEEISALTRRMAAAKKLIEGCERRRDELIAISSHERPAEPPIPLKDLLARIAEIRSARETAWLEKTRVQMRRDSGLKSLDTLDGIPCEGKFPTCRFISEALRFQEERETIETAIASFNDGAVEMTAQLAVLEDYEVAHRSVSEWDRKNATSRAHLSECEQELYRQRQVEADCTTRLADLSRELAEVQQTIRESSAEEVSNLRRLEEIRSTEVRLFRGRIDSTLREMGGLDVKIKSLEDDLEALNGLKSRVQAHELVLEMCGKNGIPYKILSMILPLINAEIAKVLAGVVKFSVFFEDDPEEQNVGIFIRYGDYRSRPLSLGSGAEKFIALLAIRGALLSVSSLPKTDILIIDEGFGKLDPEHLEALQRMFEYLREAFGKVFVISHVDFMRDIVDHSIEITSCDGYAHVEVT